jgi:hypothetical protein
VKNSKSIQNSLFRGNQNPYIEEEQTTQFPKEKVQKDMRENLIMNMDKK